MESLELYYPQLYKKITGKEPSRVFSMIIGNVCVLKTALPLVLLSRARSFPCLAPCVLGKGSGKNSPGVTGWTGEGEEEAAG